MDNIIINKLINIISNMGASLVYLDKPNKKITFTEGENEFIRYVAGDMQGWRINMVNINYLRELVQQS